MSQKEFSEKLLEFSSGVSILSFVIGIIFIRHIKGYLIPVIILVFLSLIAEIINLILVKSATNNFYIFHIYTLFEFTLWIFFYFAFYKQYIGTRYAFFILIPIFYAICYADYKINGLKTIDGFSLTAEALIFTVFSLFSFLAIIRKSIFKNLLSVPFFYVNAGMLFYFLGNLFLFAFSNYILNEGKENYLNSWTLHDILNITFNFLICIAFWKSRTA